MSDGTLPTPAASPETTGTVASYKVTLDNGGVVDVGKFQHSQFYRLHFTSPGGAVTSFGLSPAAMDAVVTLYHECNSLKALEQGVSKTARLVYHLAEGHLTEVDGATVHPPETAT